MEKPANVYTVTEITREIKSLLISKFDDVWVEGELSNVKVNSSGHIYPSLKDENSLIKMALFKSTVKSIGFNLEDGMKVRVHGYVNVYENSGSYQIVVDLVEPLGIGALQIKFEQLKQKLLKEGLFNESHKRKIPFFPQKIGIITSPTGAAIRDILNIINRRFSNVHIVINPVRVQGAEAAKEIANAIYEMNEIGDFDVLIVGRGGGSLEDLWAFNEEIVARAIYSSKIPIVSAVGHEIDYTISDFVADKRASTPSTAAELVVREKKSVIEELESYKIRLKQDLYKRYETYKEKVNGTKKGLIAGLKRTFEVYKERLSGLKKTSVFLRPKDRILELKQELDDAINNLKKAFKHFTGVKNNEVKILEGKIYNLNPLKILERGYSVCTKLPENTIVKDSSVLKPEDEIKIKFHKGDIKSKVVA
ncbi:MAG: exodeoxyribonuclease VII large subunit [Candidatus Firestonebacteria bacterium]